jgi:hypothetical protein
MGQVRIKFLIGVAAIYFVGISSAADSRNLSVQSAANTDKRVALVIGNGRYVRGAALKNSTNDARDMASSLRGLGFDVIEKRDVTQKEMNRAIIEFGNKLTPDTVALFYFAGHGMQVRGKNYLLPVDAQIGNESTVRAETVDVDTVLDQLGASPLNIVILDACRNNPFERKFRSTGGGLAQIDAPKGTLIAYATAPGHTAADGDGKNGLYTQELLKAMQQPGLTVEQVFKRVRSGVTRASNDQQTPWESSSLTGEFYFKAGTQVAQLGGGIGSGRSKEQIEDELWDAIKNEGKPSVFEEYIKQYPKGRYLAQARVKLASLRTTKPINSVELSAPKEMWEFLFNDSKYNVDYSVAVNSFTRLPSGFLDVQVKGVWVTGPLKDGTSYKVEDIVVNCELGQIAPYLLAYFSTDGAKIQQSRSFYPTRDDALKNPMIAHSGTPNYFGPLFDHVCRVHWRLKGEAPVSKATSLRKRK